MKPTVSLFLDDDVACGYRDEYHPVRRDQPYAEYLNNLFLISLSNTINDFGVFDIWKSDGKLKVKQMRKTALTNCDKVVRFDSNFEVNREGVVECEGGG